MHNERYTQDFPFFGTTVIVIANISTIHGLKCDYNNDYFRFQVMNCYYNYLAVEVKQLHRNYMCITCTLAALFQVSFREFLFIFYNSQNQKIWYLK